VNWLVHNPEILSLAADVLSVFGFLGSALALWRIRGIRQDLYFRANAKELIERIEQVRGLIRELPTDDPNVRTLALEGIRPVLATLHRVARTQPKDFKAPVLQLQSIVDDLMKAREGKSSNQLDLVERIWLCRAELAICAELLQDELRRRQGGFDA
jgi:hypothetical protein